MSMLKRVANLPFTVLGKVARAVQEHEDRKMHSQYGEGQDGADFSSGDGIPGWDTPDDYEAPDAAMTLAQVQAYEGDHAKVDLRAIREYEAGHVEGAESMPIPELAIRLAELPPAGTRVILLCQDGASSANAARFLRFRGIEETFYLEGGMAAWKRKGLEVVGGRS